MKAYQFQKFGLENLELVERETPHPNAGEVLVKFHAASLNFRDLLFARGVYNPHPTFPAVPLSDGAGEVMELGEGVHRWQVGERVCPIFIQGWFDGARTHNKKHVSLGGGELDGTLREYGVFPADGLVRIPTHLSHEEASTLPCAAVTAWNALVSSGQIKAGQTILTLGSGGVSVFALQLAKMHGARVIATSSSDDKLAKLTLLGADEVINYVTTPAWDKEVALRTNGLGVDHVVEVGGAGTLGKSINSTCIGGRISMIGVLTSGSGVDPTRVLMKSLCLQGIYVGSRRMFEELSRALETTKLHPVIDRTFPFAQAREALEYLATGSHFGKVVITDFP